MQHPDEGAIQAWLDGELTSDEVVALEQHTAECAECSRNVAEARGLMAAASNIVRSLDTVPGGVIPLPVRKQRSWFASAQLRAAAAVVVVAGGSLLVARGLQEPERLTETAAVATPELPANVDRVADAAGAVGQSAVSQSADAAVASPSRETAKSSVSRRVAVTPPNAGSDRSAATLSAPPATPTAPVGSAPAVSVPSVAQRDRTANQREERVAAEQAVDSSKRVAGVSAAPDAVGPSLVEMSRDSSAVMIRTVYSTGSGVEVTLVESFVRSFAASAAADRAPVERQASPVVPTTRSSATINSISWVALNGRRMTLSGHLSAVELELLKATLPAKKRERVP